MFGNGPERNDANSGDVQQEQLFAEQIPVETRREILNALVDRAKGGDVRVAAFLFDRLYGRPAMAEATRDLAGARADLRRLDDGELDTFVALYRKAVAGHVGTGERGGDHAGEAPAALPAGPGGIREGGS